MSGKVTILIGSGEQSLLERKVLIYSIHKHTKRELDIRVFNGTHNSIESANEPPVPAPLSLELKYRNMTEFSLYRYLIPEVCSFNGKAIYLDSDMVCLRDIGELFDSPLDGFDFLAKREYSDRDGEKMWGLSAMLIDNERCRFDLQKIFSEIDEGLYTYTEFSQMGKRFLEFHNYGIGELDPQWNVFDRRDSQTKLVHYTDLFQQPWKYHGHPYGELWHDYFREAQEQGWISENDISLTIRRGYARPDVREGNSRSFGIRLKSRVLSWVR